MSNKAWSSERNDLIEKDDSLLNDEDKASIKLKDFWNITKFEDEDPVKKISVTRPQSTWYNKISINSITQEGVKEINGLCASKAKHNNGQTVNVEKHSWGFFQWKFLWLA